MRRPRVFLAAESLLPGMGGICRVARLMARVLDELAAAGELTARAVTLNDPRRPDDLDLKVALARGSRAAFVARVLAATPGHSHFLYDFLGMARAHARLLGRQRPFATWLHGIEVWESGAASRLTTAARADRLFANTRYTRDRADRLHGGFGDARVCWLATETDPPAPRHDPPPGPTGPPTVLIVARLSLEEDYKGHDRLIDCWPRVLARVPDARLVIVGQGPSRLRLEAQAASLPLAAPRIEFRGFVPDDRMAAVWAETSVFAMPSRGEGFGLVYIEAMQHGIPVVASIHDAAPEINLHEVTGYNVDLDQPDDLATRLITLLENPDLARRLGQAGRRHWAEHFCYGAFRRRFEPLLQAFLQRPPA